MKKYIAGLLLLTIILTFPLVSANASEVDCESIAPVEIEQTENGKGSSIFSWYLHPLSEGAFEEFSPIFEEMNITRIYQQLPIVYLQQQTVTDMVSRLNERGIEVIALIGEKEWGLPGSNIRDAFAYIDALAAYNAGSGINAPIRKLALDVETYTYKEWSRNPRGYFSSYVNAMKRIYDYAHKCGLEVVQIIPVFLDTIDEDIFHRFVSTCTDELALMNYTKSSQISAIKQEVELCKALDIPVETIFETKPTSDRYSVTEKNTFFYNGLTALQERKNEILETYGYDKLSAGYHHLTTVYHMITGRYIAEIYAYTDKNDPTRDNLGQTGALDRIILTGDNGSIVTAYLYNPNLDATYPESCYLAVGIEPDVVYTITSPSAEYTVTENEITFVYEDNDLTDTDSTRLLRIAPPPAENDEDDVESSPENDLPPPEAESDSSTGTASEDDTPSRGECANPGKNRKGKNKRN